MEKMDFYAHIKQIEMSLVIQAMTATMGNRNQASKLLSMNRTTLVEKLKRLDLNKDRPYWKALNGEKIEKLVS